MMKNTFNQPDKDAGWGLIFRLNGLWDMVDRKAQSGRFDDWEVALDRIYSNLLYRNPVEEIKDDDGNVIDVKLADKDVKVRRVLKSKISKCKLDQVEAIKKRDALALKKAKQEHYNSLLIYEVWLRKFMQEHKLYLKEHESNPSKAMWSN